MTTECAILVGIFDGFSWIRCEGKGSFLNSPVVKAFGEERIAAGEKCLVIDLAGCIGMDSTFMGTLAGMAARVSSNQGGVLQIAEAGSRNLRSLEDLGLDFLMQIDPPGAVWSGELETIRSRLAPPNAVVLPGSLQRSQHVLEAHHVLSGLNEKNSKAFSGVVKLLESDQHGKQNLVGPSEKS